MSKLNLKYLKSFKTPRGKVGILKKVDGFYVITEEYPNLYYTGFKNLKEANKLYNDILKNYK